MAGPTRPRCSVPGPCDQIVPSNHAWASFSGPLPQTSGAGGGGVLSVSTCFFMTDQRENSICSQAHILRQFRWCSNRFLFQHAFSAHIIISSVADDISTKKSPALNQQWGILQGFPLYCIMITHHPCILPKTLPCLALPCHPNKNLAPLRGFLETANEAVAFLRATKNGFDTVRNFEAPQKKTIQKP